MGRFWYWSASFYLLVLQVFDHCGYSCSFNLSIYDVSNDTMRLSPYFISAMEKAYEVCPRQKLCGGMLKDFENDLELLEMYTAAMEKQANASYGSDNPCCFPCSCEADCWINRNCCPDAFDTRGNATEEQGLITRESLCYLPYRLLPPRGMNLLTEKKIPFRLFNAVTYCLSATQACPSGDFEQSFDESVFRQDELGRVYKNRKCAECNHVTSTTRFVLLLIICLDLKKKTAMPGNCILRYLYLASECVKIRFKMKMLCYTCT